MFVGMVADYLGRTKTLIITILIYAIFTGLAALSQDWWHPAVYRFLTALGIGREWAAGAALVAETWPEEKRAKAAAYCNRPGRLDSSLLHRSIYG